MSDRNIAIVTLILVIASFGLLVRAANGLNRDDLEAALLFSAGAGFTLALMYGTRK